MSDRVKNIMQAQAIALESLREFFNNEGLTEVLTPPVVPNPGMEVHIHPYKISSAKDNKEQDLYLHTSPEFNMKWLMSQGMENIYTISYCFRDEPKSPIHRPQFLMLEWYRSQCSYEKIMEDCERLIKYCLDKFEKKGYSLKMKSPEPIYMTVAEAFSEFCQIDILNLDNPKKLRAEIEGKHKDIPLPKEELPWDDLFFLVFLNKIEPKFKEIPFLILKEYPAQLRALSTLKKEDPRVCERFEIYLSGVEIANCFNELRDLDDQKKLFNVQRSDKKELYGYELPEPNILYESLEKGFPESAGIALGVERLISALIDCDDSFFPY